MKFHLVPVGSDNGLVPDGTKPLPEPMLTYCQVGKPYDAILSSIFHDSRWQQWVMRSHTPLALSGNAYQFRCVLISALHNIRPNADLTHSRSGGRRRPKSLRIMRPGWWPLQELRISTISLVQVLIIYKNANGSPFCVLVVRYSLLYYNSSGFCVLVFRYG